MSPDSLYLVPASAMDDAPALTVVALMIAYCVGLAQIRDWSRKR